jgi:hypothetical protein
MVVLQRLNVDFSKTNSQPECSYVDYYKCEKVLQSLENCSKKLDTLIELTTIIEKDSILKRKR